MMMYCDVLEWLYTGFGLMTWLIDHLYIQLVTADNYNAIVNLHILKITRVHAKSAQSASTSRFLVTDLNHGDSWASVLTSFPSGWYSTTELLLQLSLVFTDYLVAPDRPGYNIPARTAQKAPSLTFPLFRVDSSPWEHECVTIVT
jgi:hypothetical protein